LLRWLLFICCGYALRLLLVGWLDVTLLVGCWFGCLRCVLVRWLLLVWLLLVCCVALVGCLDLLVTWLDVVTLRFTCVWVDVGCWTLVRTLLGSAFVALVWLVVVALIALERLVLVVGCCCWDILFGWFVAFAVMVFVERCG